MQEELTSLLRAKPFIPFVIVTIYGDCLEVSHVDFLNVGHFVCAYVNLEGSTWIMPYNMIKQVRAQYDSD
jgi:hypothetical protein